MQYKLSKLENNDRDKRQAFTLVLTFLERYLLHFSFYQHLLYFTYRCNGIGRCGKWCISPCKLCFTFYRHSCKTDGSGFFHSYFFRFLWCCNYAIDDDWYRHDLWHKLGIRFGSSHQLCWSITDVESLTDSYSASST